MIYLAAPYSTGLDPDTDPILAQEQRFAAITEACAKLRIKGHMVYSPITMGKPMEQYLPQHLVEDHSFWMDHCYHMLELCEEVWVLTLPGWQESRGVTLEREWAWAKVRVRYVDPYSLEVR